MMMNFLEQSDYRTFINPELLSMLLAGDIDKLEEAEGYAYGHILSNLSARYNMQTEFSRSGTARNQTLVRWMLSLSVYFLHNTVADTDIPERVAKNYDDVRREIEAVASGKAATNLLPLLADGKAKTRFRWGSSPKRSHNPFE